MEPAESTELKPQHSLWGEWLLDKYSAARLCVKKRPQALFKEVGRQTLVTVMALLIALALVMSIYANLWDTAWLTWPLVALFSGVAALGLLGVVRALRHALGGIRLEVDMQQKTLWGLAVPRDFCKAYAAKVRGYALQEVQAVVLHTYHPAGAERRSNRAMCELIVQLKDGTCLQGPDVFAPESYAQERLLPLAQAIAHMASLPLELKEEPLPPSPRKPFAFFRSR